MKRKISLLLAFVMIFSLLPMTVAANDLGPNRTGQRHELHPMSSIVHMRDGTVVARPHVANHFLNNHTRANNPVFEVSAAQPINIVIAADYFLGRRAASNVPAAQRPWVAASVYMNMTLSNAYWLINTVENIPAPTSTTVAALANAPTMAYADYSFELNGQWFTLSAWITPGPRNTDARLHFTIVYDDNGVLTTANINAEEFRTITATNLANLASVFLPVEFFTRSGANDYPITLTYQAQHLWHTPGVMTVSAVPTQGRFVISRPGTMRAFHEFGRAEVRDSIRIAEGTPGAFNAQWYFVELEIITPGFEWGAGSLEFELTNRHGAAPQGLIANAPTSLRNFVGTTAQNNRRTIRFQLNTPNAASGSRIQLDWVNIEGLQVLATDRARDGYVEVEVRLYNAYYESVNGAPPSVLWQYLPTGVAGNAAFDALTIEDRDFVRAEAAIMAQWDFYSSILTTPPVYNVFADVAGLGVIGSVQVVLPGEPGPAGFTLVGFIEPSAIFGSGTGGLVRVPGTINLATGRVNVARFGQIGLELFVHEDDDAADFELRSGMQEWTFWNDVVTQGSGWNIPGGAVNLPGEITHRGAVQPESPHEDFHRTARVVLRETVPGSLPATGASPTTFTFDEGVQVLGVRFWTNGGPFINADRHLGNNNYAHLHNNNDTAWFGVNRSADNPMRASIARNTVTIRPELGRVVDPRYSIAQITAEFYLSVQPGFEYLYGSEIEVTVTSGTVNAPFREAAVVAYAYDPIFVETTPIVIDEDASATFGLVRGISIEDIVVTETYEGLLLPGQIIWVGVEGGVSRSWGRADHLSLMAGNVRVVGCDRLDVSAPRSNSHGVYVEIMRGSATTGAQIIFEDVVVSGAILPNQTYNIMVAGDAVAGNWNGFAWLAGHETGSALGRTTLHGFFSEEPYAAEAFSFEGADTALVQGPQGPQPPINGPVTFGLNSSHRLRDGDTVTAPVFVLQPNLTNPRYVTSYVSARVVADLAGLPWGNGYSTWNDVTGTATFTDGNVTIEFTAGSSTAIVNGESVAITAGGLAADARIVGGRMMVPISFFNTIPWFPLNVRWNSYVDPSQRSITITPVQ